VHNDEIPLDDTLGEMVRKIRATDGLPSTPPRGRGTMEEILQHVDPNPVSEEEALEFVRMIYADRRNGSGPAVQPGLPQSYTESAVEEISINDSLEEMVRKIRANGGPPSTPPAGSGTLDEIIERTFSEPISNEDIDEFVRIIYADRSEAGKALPPE
jgi:hypothetical protein